MDRISDRTYLTVLAAALVWGLVALATAPSASAAPVIGQPAPGFSGVDSSGKTVRLSDFRGRTVVLEWTNHGCPYVGKHYDTDNMQALQKQAAAQGVVWLSIISSAPGRQGHVSPAEANDLTVSRKAAPASVILDPRGNIGRAYEATATPHMFVINREGVLVYKGAIDDRPSANHDDVKTATNYVRTALNALAEGKLPKPAATRAYGCSVKYAD